MPIAQEVDVINLWIATDLLTEPIDEVQTILIVNRRIGFLTEVDVGEHSALLQWATKLLNIQGRHGCDRIRRKC